MLLCHVIRRLGNIRLQLLTLLQQRGCIGVSAQSVILRSVDGLDQLFGLLDQRAAPFSFVEQNVVYSTGRSQKVCRRIGVFAQPQGQQLLFEPCDRSVKTPELLRQDLREKMNRCAIDMLKRIPLHGQSHIIRRQRGSDEQRHSLENAGAAVCLDQVDLRSLHQSGQLFLLRVGIAASQYRQPLD